jgi:hypothetical protein
MRNSTTNGGNAAFGYQSLQNSTANLNAGFGAGSMRGLTNGIFNTAIGTNCGVNMGGSTDNVLVGGLAGNTLTGGSNNIIVGKSAEPSSPTASNEITLGDANITSLRIPGLQSGASANDILTFNGTDITLAAPAGGGLSWQPVITTNTTATASQGFFVNTSGGAVTLTLPATPTQGDEVAFVDYAGTAATNNITIGRNGENMQTLLKVGY